MVQNVGDLFKLSAVLLSDPVEAVAILKTGCLFFLFTKCAALPSPGGARGLLKLHCKLVQVGFRLREQSSQDSLVTNGKNQLKVA